MVMDGGMTVGELSSFLLYVIFVAVRHPGPKLKISARCFV